MLHGVVGGERLVVDIHLDVRVEIEHALAGRFDLQLADAGGAVDHLALQVGVIHHVVIHQADAPDPGRRQVQRHRRAQPARADDQHRGGFELALPFQPDFGDEQVARVAQDFFSDER